MKDWNSKEIQVGDLVRHVYAPWPAGSDHSCPGGKGYHSHYLGGAHKVREIVNETCVRLDITFRSSPVFLGALLEVVPSAQYAATTSYIVPLEGPYREPEAA